MPLTRQQFVEQLQLSGIMTAEALTLFEEPQDSNNETAEQFAEQLIQQKKLTQFQSQMIFQGHGDRLLLGEYLLLDKIGAGGMGQVFLAEHRRMERRVALKTLPDTLTQDAQAIHRFHREVQASAKLSHPNIVTAHDAGESKGIHYFVMEHVQGTDLASLVKEHGSLTITQAVNFIMQTATGLEYAHNKGIIHRDIKPDNILLDQEGIIKILDMGLARIDSEAGDQAKTQLTQTGNVIGTVNYMSPEQAQDTHAADARSDIYSLGCMLHFLLTGESVYDGDSVINRILAHRDKPIPSLSVNHAHIPPELDAVFQKMVAKQPEDRYQSMIDVINDLQACKIEGVSSVAPIQPITKEIVSESSPTQPISANSLDNTILTPAPGQAAESSQTSKGRQRIALAVMLISVFLVALLFINQNTKTDSPQSTILLEIDQPELAGAILLVDDQPRGVIKTGVGPESITLPVDEKMHVIKVTQAGFEDFTKQVTVKDAAPETIQVRLVPLSVAKTAPQAKSHNALRFQNDSDKVILPLKHKTAGDLTVEAWVTIDENSMRPQNFITNGSNKNGFYLGTSGFQGNKKQWSSTIANNDQYQTLKSKSKVEFGKRTNIAVSYNGNVAQIYVNGHKKGELNFKGSEIHTDNFITIGFPLASALNFKGTIDEVRFSNFARYSEDFTPKNHFENDLHTLAIYHFDEAKGDVLKDSSGNGHDGKIVGAKWVKVDDLNADSPGNSIQNFYNIVWNYGGQILSWDAETQTHLELSPQSNIPVEKIRTYTLKFKDLKQFEDNQLIQIAEAYRKVPITKSINIDLSGTQISAKGIKALASLPVSRLVLNRNPAIDDAIATSIPRFDDQLTNLSLQATAITDATIKALSSLKGLRILNLQKTAITPNCVPHLAMLDIEELNVLLTGIDASAVLKLKAALPQCQIIWDGGIVNANESAIDPHRRAAEMMLQRGINIHITTMNRRLRISELAQIPPERFAITGLSPITKNQLSDADWKSLDKVETLNSIINTFALLSDVSLNVLKDFKSLRTLDLSSSGITDAGVATLSNLSDLSRLTLSGNTEITDNACDDLIKLKALRHLAIPGTAISIQGLKKLAALSELNSLEFTLSEKISAKGLAHLSLFPSLTSLIIFGDVDNDEAIENLVKLKSLQKIDLNYVTISDARANRLQKLMPECVILHTAISTSAADLKAAKWVIENAGTIGTFKSRQFSKQLPEESFRISLIQLSEAKKTLTGSENLADLHSLQVLMWPGGLTNADSHLASIKNTKSLKEIHLAESDVTAAGFEYLKKLSQLKQLHTTGNQELSDDALAHLADLQNLWIIVLTNTPISDTGLSHIGQLQNLRSLYLNACSGISGDGLKHLNSLPRLNNLDLAGSPVTDVAIPHLQKMKSLRILNLVRTKVSPAAVISLQAALPDCVIFHESLKNIPWKK